MKKSYTVSDHVVVKDHFSENKYKSIPRSEMNQFATELFSGTLLECNMWTKASSPEERTKVEQWAEARKKIRLPLPSDNKTELESRREALEQSFGSKLAEEKAKVVEAKKHKGLSSFNSPGLST